MRLFKSIKNMSDLRKGDLLVAQRTFYSNRGHWHFEGDLVKVSHIIGDSASVNLLSQLGGKTFQFLDESEFIAYWRFR